MQTDVHYLESEHVGDEFAILVGQCTLPDEQPTEILFVADGPSCFGAAMDIAQFLRLFRNLPPLLIVGVGYRAAHIRETVPMRDRDLTPTFVEERPGSGGAPAFLGFIREELSPWLSERYGADPGQAAYWGSSLAGLFGAWVLLHEPSTFHRYGLSSPSLWWDGGVMFQREAEYARTHDDLAARVLVSAGELERPSAQRANVHRLPEGERAKARAEAATDHVDMATGASLFADALASRSYPSLETEFQIYPGENHVTAWSVSLSRSMRYLWDLRD
jgi:predicted alpha/beta superfamily hydrolase